MCEVGEVLFEGPQKKVVAFKKNNGSVPAKEFLENKIDTVTDRVNIEILFQRICNIGKISNVEKFRHEGDGIYAFKQNQIRLYCFMGKRGEVILTHGTIKKRNKMRPADRTKAKLCRAEYDVRYAEYEKKKGDEKETKR